MNFCNPKFTAAGSIDLEIDHPRLGWIWTTAAPWDEATAALFDEAKDDAVPFVPEPEPEPSPPTSGMINAERDRRLAGVFTFGGKQYDCDPDSMARITGAATLAGFAIGAGAQPGDLDWMPEVAEFVWIAADNTLTAMDAQTMFAFGQAAAANQAAHVFAGRALKEMDPIPAEYTSDEFWPAPGTNSGSIS